MQGFVVHVLQGSEAAGMLTPEEVNWLCGELGPDSPRAVEGLSLDVAARRIIGEDADEEELAAIMLEFVRKFRPAMVWCLQTAWWPDDDVKWARADPRYFGSIAWIVSVGGMQHINVTHWLDDQYKKLTGEARS